MDPKPPTTPYRVSVWRGITNMWQNFKPFISFEVSTGNVVRFWDDLWCGVIPLKSRFPAVYSMVYNKSALVADVMRVEGNCTSWDLGLRRQINDWEMDELATLMEVLDQFRRGQDMHDIRIWAPDEKGIFSVKSLYLLLTKDQRPKFISGQYGLGFSGERARLFSLLVLPS
ncbi:hypothetical protein BVC80_1469g12 [Macleaya cordata]|uniref:Reverse transcriptase zinc-binding domain n=1 Tax=Macleaya cordata TaxID=56857 RepID=A0A200PUV7_MACCD|nr:hypothetical protein BVC80_1469g12 [Macleaya cordata]